MRIRALRSLEVTDESGRVVGLSDTQRRLLAYLVIHRGQVVSIRHLADALDTSVRAVHMTVSRLRDVAGRSAVATVGRGYMLGPADLDLPRFEALMLEAQRADASQRISLLGDALDLFSGAPFGDLGAEHWAQAECVRLREMRGSALEDRADALLLLRRFDEAGAALIAHIDEFPFRDRPRSLLMRALSGQGRLTEALRVYHEYRALLAEEVGTKPSAELRTLEAGLASGRHEEAALAIVPSPVVHLPETVATTPLVRFVGRDDELETLSHAWALARQGRRRVSLLGGEPGTGKTRLAIEAARRCADAGATVLFGACDSELAMPYRPWGEILEALIRSFPASELAHISDELDSLSVLMPTVEAVNRASHRGEATDPDADRYRLLLAVDRVISHATKNRALVVVIDDLQWADAHTLALLRHLSRSVAPARLLVIATFRDTGDDMIEPLTKCLADLHRSEGTQRLRVSGLDEDHVVELITSIVGHPLDGALTTMARSLADRSAGNPFYVGELWRHFQSIGAVNADEGRWSVRFSPRPADVPDTVREVVAARLLRVSTSARSVAELLAVHGLSADLRVLRAAHLPGPQDLLEGLDELVRVHLLVAVDEDPLPNYRFAHAIVRDTILRNIGPAQRAWLHQRIGIAIEVVFAADPLPVLSDLARHFAACASIGDPSVAVHYARLAANRAMEAHAHEEAMALLDTVAALAPPGSPESVDVLIDRTQVSTRAGLDPHAIDALSAALRHALDLGLVDQAARAVFELQIARQLQGLPASNSVDMINEVLSLPGFTDTRLRLRVRAGAVGALHYSGRSEEADALAEVLMSEGRAIDDPQFFISFLREVSSNSTNTRPEVVLRTCQEMCDLAESVDDLWTYCWGAGNVVRGLLMLGRVSDAAAALERHRQAAERGRYDIFRYQAVVFDAVFGIIDGRFEDAERFATSAAELFPQRTEFDSGLYGLQMYVVRRGQRRLGEVASILQLAARSDGLLWRPGLAALYAQLGQLEEAEREYAVLAADGFSTVPRDAIWPACLAFLSEVCVFIGDREHAALLYEELEPFTGLTIMVAYTVCLGPADTLLGALAALLGETDRAATHFRSAVEIAQLAGSPVWLAEAQRAQALALGAEAGRVAE